jgi:hypothetical protein
VGRWPREAIDPLRVTLAAIDAGAGIQVFDCS